MKTILFWTLFILFSGVCYAEDITIRYHGEMAKVKQKTKDSVRISVDGAKVNIESLYKSHQLTLRLSGKSEDGQLNLKANGKVSIKLEGLTLTSQEGAPLCLKNKKKVEIVVAKGTENTLTITACNDTANHKGVVIWAKDKLLFSGMGTLNVIATGDGCRGIKTKKDITIEDVTLNVRTSGDNLGEKPFGFGGFPDFGGEMPDFSNIPGFENDSTRRGGFPPFGGNFPGFGNDSIQRGDFPIPDFGGNFPGFENDSTRQGGFQFPPFGGKRPFDNDSIGDGEFPDFGGGFGGKHKYVASTKGIASKGKITINSGHVTVRTSTAGAEGIEGKEGIVFNGGYVDVLTTDDAINANATIEFNGSHVLAISKGNDAVDSNPKGGFFMPFGNNREQNNEPAIIIRGGTVYAWSQVGSPEEGLDCDFAPLVIEGGNLFTVGGGMGEMPSVPTNDTAKQPTVLLIGLKVAKDEPINIYDGNDKLLNTVTIPFSLRRSATLVGNPTFKVGNTYKVKTKDYEKTFTINEPFTVVR